MVVLEDVREMAQTLPRAQEAVRGRVKFRVGSIVWLETSRDETEMSFAFPKEWRDALVESEPDKFVMPREVDLKYNWAVVRLEAIDYEEMREIITDAWSMVVPKYVVEEYLLSEM